MRFAMLNSSYRSVMLYVLVLSFGFPISLSGDIPVSLPDIMMVGTLLGLLVIGKLEIPRNTIWLLFSIAFSIFVIFFESVRTSQSLRSFLSLGFFFKPYLAYLVGFSLIRDEESLRVVLRSTLPIFSFVLLISLLSSVGNIRDGIYFFGIEIFGSKGVNALMVYLVLLVMMFQAGGVRAGGMAAHLIALSLGAMAVSILLFASSRQALFGLLLFYFLTFMRGRLFLLLLLFFGIFMVFYLFPPDVLLVKASRDAEALAAGDIDAFSAGRTLLYAVMISDIWSNPLFGNGFAGFSFQNLPLGFEYAEGLSPHNQYLGALWKMGLVAFIFYAAFLVSAVRNIWRPCDFVDIRRAELIGMTLVVLIIFMNTQDFLTFSLTGNVFMFVLGGVGRLCRFISMSKSNRVPGAWDVSR